MDQILSDIDTITPQKLKDYADLAFSQYKEIQEKNKKAQALENDRESNENEAAAL